MKILKKNLNKKFNKILNLFLISSTLLGAAIFPDEVKASTPDVCKDVFGAKDSSGKYSKNKNEIKSITYFCSDTPDRFEITIYELGLCTGAPFSKSSTTFNRDSGNCVITMTSDGSTVDLANSIVSLPEMNGRPPSNNYQYAYVIIKNEFGLRGSIKIDDGIGGTSHYCSDSNGDSTSESSSCTALNHTEELDNFGDDDNFSAFFPANGDNAASMSGGGAVSALLTKDNLTTASVKTESTRLIGLFITDPTNKVSINNSTVGLEMQLQVSDIGYGIEFDSNTGEPVGFGSMPFKPIFTTF